MLLYDRTSAHAPRGSSSTALALAQSGWIWLATTPAPRMYVTSISSRSRCISPCRSLALGRAASDGGLCEMRCEGHGWLAYRSTTAVQNIGRARLRHHATTTTTCTLPLHTTTHHCTSTTARTPMHPALSIHPRAETSGGAQRRGTAGSGWRRAAGAAQLLRVSSAGLALFYQSPKPA